MSSSDQLTLAPILPPIRLWLRSVLLITGVVFPASCVAMVAAGVSPTVDQLWQSGELQDYAGLFLRFPTLGVFLPLVVFCMASMTAWTIRPELARLLPVRSGIYFGVPLAAQFFVLALMTSGLVTVVAAMMELIPIALLVLAAHWFRRCGRQFSLLHLMLATTACAVIIAAAVAFGKQDLLGWLLLPLFAIAPATPTLNLAAYLIASWYVLERSSRTSDVTWKTAGSEVALLAAWGGSWKIAVDLMLIEYAKLPTTNPNCYVSSAAACGHRRWVRSEWLDWQAMPPLVVNQQMRRLKFLELALQAAHPTLHRRLRRFYDRVGPRLAAHCRHRIWWADVTYILLKPAEFLAEAIRTLAGVPAQQVAALYRSPPSSSEVRPSGRLLRSHSRHGFTR